MLLLAVIIGFCTASIHASLTELSGFHCMMRHSMRMNRAVHGEPQQTSPPFQFQFLDSKGVETRYYEPGKVYTIRLIGFVHFRGLLLQARLTNENGFLLGSLKGGRFIENKNWETFGIRIQNCNRRSPSFQDTITHSDDSRKFIVQADWTSDKDVGAVQFMLTIAEEDEIYWERWRPKSGFIVPASWNGKHMNIISEVFTDEKAAIELAVKKQKFDESQMSSLQAENYRNVSNVNGDQNSTVIINGSSNSFDGKSASSQNVVFEANQSKSMIPETLRDLAYRHENEIEELEQKTFSSDLPSEKFEASRSGSSSAVFGIPNKRTTVTWQPRMKNIDEFRHIYEGRFPKISAANLMNDASKLKTPAAQNEKCLENPCQNGGQCRPNSTKKEGFVCSCRRGWTGSLCQMKDHCIGHNCVSGDCVSLEDSYECSCWKDYAGKFCTRKCEPNLCKRNGTCVEKSSGELGCKCPPGASGRYCEREINECNFRRCKNGAKCIDRWNDYECICEPGWMGKDCDRPCQDIYGSCGQWKRQGQCEQMRDHTRFFDANCAVSCGQCVFANDTVMTKKPLAPILLPLAWMIGVWRAEVNGTRSRAVDYVTDFDAASYTEILAITVADVLMFGKPSINFTSTAVNKNDTTDQHIHYGFLTIAPNSDGNPFVALITASNLGQIMIEEGEIRSNSIQFTPKYRSALSLTADKLPIQLQRTFSKSDKRLVQTLTKTESDGRNRSLSKRYEKVVDIEYL